MRVEIHIVGGQRKIDEITTRFSRMAGAVVNPTPAFVSVTELLFEIEDAIFNSQGRRGGGSWAQITEEWRTRKMLGGLDSRIGHATLALRESVTEPDAPGQILDMDNNTLIFGSDLPYAETQQRHRPFVRLLPEDRLRIRNRIRNHIIRAWNLQA